MQESYAKVGMNAGPIPTRVPQVEQETVRLDSDIGRLEATVETLYKTLSAVLRSEPPQPSLDEKQVAEVLVQRADAIRHQRNRITQVSNLIDSILARLEV